MLFKPARLACPQVAVNDEVLLAVSNHNLAYPGGMLEFWVREAGGFVVYRGQAAQTEGWAKLYAGVSSCLRCWGGRSRAGQSALPFLQLHAAAACPTLPPHLHPFLDRPSTSRRRGCAMRWCWRWTTPPRRPWSGPASLRSGWTWR